MIEDAFLVLEDADGDAGKVADGRADVGIIDVFHAVRFLILNNDNVSGTDLQYITAIKW